MHRSNFSFAKALAAVLIAGAAASAHAGPGDGIRIGGSEGRLHPFLDIETRYDSNVSYTPADEAIADMIVHFRPGMELKLPGDLAAVEFSGALDWAQYLGIQEDTTSLSRLFGEARIAALFARRSPVSVRIDNDFRRQVSSSSLSAAASAVVSNVNTLALSVPWTPGGGALVIAAKGEWLLETFEKYQDQDALAVADLGYSQFRGGAEVQWRFLPRTTAVFRAAYYDRVPNGTQDTHDTSGFDVSSGVVGLLTPRISGVVHLGYGGRSTGAKDSQSLVADVGAEWLLMDSFSFRAGYNRSFGVDPTASVYISDGLSAGARLKIADRVALRAGVRYDRFEFQSIPGADTTFLRVDPTVEGMVGRWLSVACGYVYSSRVASWQNGTPPPDYAKNEAFLKVGLTY